MDILFSGDTRRMFLDLNQKPLNGMVQFLDYGTSNQKAIYNEEGTPISNPVSCSFGTLETSVKLIGKYTVNQWLYVGNGDPVSDWADDDLRALNFIIDSTYPAFGDSLQAPTTATNIISVDTIDALKNINTESNLILVKGYYTLGDCPSRYFFRDSSGTANSGSCFKSNNGEYYWKLLLTSSEIDASCFGIVAREGYNYHVEMADFSLFCLQNRIQRAIFKDSIWFSGTADFGYTCFVQSNIIYNMFTGTGSIICSDTNIITTGLGGYFTLYAEEQKSSLRAIRTYCKKLIINSSLHDLTLQNLFLDFHGAGNISNCIIFNCVFSNAYNGCLLSGNTFSNVHEVRSSWFSETSIAIGQYTGIMKFIIDSVCEVTLSESNVITSFVFEKLGGKLKYTGSNIKNIECSEPLYNSLDGLLCPFGFNEVKIDWYLNKKEALVAFGYIDLCCKELYISDGDGVTFYSNKKIRNGTLRLTNITSSFDLSMTDVNLFGYMTVNSLTAYNCWFNSNLGHFTFTSAIFHNCSITTDRDLNLTAENMGAYNSVLDCNLIITNGLRTINTTAKDVTLVGDTVSCDTKSSTFIDFILQCTSFGKIISGWCDYNSIELVGTGAEVLIIKIADAHIADEIKSSGTFDLTAGADGYTKHKICFKNITFDNENKAVYTNVVTNTYDSIGDWLFYLSGDNYLNRSNRKEVSMRLRDSPNVQTTKWFLPSGAIDGLYTEV
ncbi:MAG TPA: hypothetical protein PK616_00540, partial [Fibrobacteraceae bacterium]|nr:hypothetical protein [Fibrobacteraceae bacterium]